MNSKITEADRVFLKILNQLNKIEINKQKEKRRKLKREYKEKYTK